MNEIDCLIVEKLGLKRQTREEIQEEWDSRMRSQYFHPIENFPDKIDQLLEAMTKVRSKKVSSSILTNFLLIFFSDV